MKKTIINAVLAMAFLALPATAADAQTFLGTPRAETLIIEADAGQYKNPGMFNPSGSTLRWL